MIDVKLIQDENGQFDLTIENGDFKDEDGFDTALFVSLFTDSRASSSQVAIPEFRRGWPGDTVSTVDERPLGSLLWLIDQRRLNQTTLNNAIDYARNALIWLLDDNIATDLEVTGSIVPMSGISLIITITNLKGVTESHYINLWEVTGAN